MQAYKFRAMFRYVNNKAFFHCKVIITVCVNVQKRADIKYVSEQVLLVVQKESLRFSCSMVYTCKQIVKFEVRNNKILIGRFILCSLEPMQLLITLVTAPPFNMRMSSSCLKFLFLSVPSFLEPFCVRHNSGSLAIG